MCKIVKFCYWDIIADLAVIYTEWAIYHLLAVPHVHCHCILLYHCQLSYNSAWHISSKLDRAIKNSKARHNFTMFEQCKYSGTPIKWTVFFVLYSKGVLSSGVENSCSMIFGTLVSVLYSIDVLC